jgi:hypothetical protein
MTERTTTTIDMPMETDIEASSKSGTRAHSSRVTPSCRKSRDVMAKVVDKVANFAARLFSPFSGAVQPKVTDIAWAAGLFDGEGCIHIARQTYGKSGRRPTYRLRIDIAQNDVRILKEVEWALQIPGRIYTAKVGGRNKRVCHALKYDGVTAFEVLEKIGPMLRRKRAEADLAERFRRNCHVHTHFGPNGCPDDIWHLRVWYYKAMRALKKAGSH